MNKAEEIYRENGFSEDMMLPSHLVIILMQKCLTMTEKNKQAGMPSDELYKKAETYLLENSPKQLYKLELEDIAKLMRDFHVKELSPPKSEAKSSCDYIFDRAAEIESKSEAEVEDEIKKIAASYFPLMNYSKQEPLDENWEAYHGLIDDISRLLSAPSKNIAIGEVKFPGLWTPQYLAERLLFPTPKSIQYAEVQLKAWAKDIIEANSAPSKGKYSEEDVKIMLNYALFAKHNIDFFPNLHSPKTSEEIIEETMNINNKSLI